MRVPWADLPAALFILIDLYSVDCQPMSDKKNKAKYWLSLSGIALQMGVIIFLGAKAGQWLDAKYEGGNTYTIVLTLFAVAVSMYLVVKQTNDLNS